MAHQLFIRSIAEKEIADVPSKHSFPSSGKDSRSVPQTSTAAEKLDYCDETGL